MSTKVSLTKEQYQTLDDAYKFFNLHLFEKELPEVMILMHRKGKRNLGYFHAERFAERAKIEEAKKKKKAHSVPLIDELSLNPDNFVGRTDTAILSTLVHEMCHVWRHHLADKKPSRGGYHDKLWADKMEKVGLMPSNTGDEGGKRTGQQMTHYIIKGGKYEKFALMFLKSHKIKLTSFPLPSNSSSQNKNKVKYTCPDCEANIWGKPGLNVQCGDCDTAFVEE